MKNILLTIFLFITLSSQSQYSKIIVQLTDKNNSAYNLNNPSSFLSKRAIDRRTRYQIPLDSTDLPVTNKYVDSIRLSGNVKILSISKWLNQILIQTTDQNALTKINSFPFVKSANSVAPRISNPIPLKKFKEEINPIPFLFGNRNSGTKGDVFDYGSNFNQVHIHEGEYLHNKGFKGETIQIAVLDAGFSQYKSVTAFDSIRMNQQILGERDFVDYDNSVNEDDSHGMYCLSTMAANWPGKMIGTAPKASYWLIRTENAFTEYPVEEHNWVVGAELADSTGSDMISSSLGYFDFDDASFNHTYDQLYKNATIVSKGAAIAANKGMIVMNSAGNAGGGWWNFVAFPADVDSVCSVGAVNSAGDVAGFSSRGFPGKIKPNVVSVGVATVIAGFSNQPVSGNGTSFSNPNLAGLVACLWQAFPQFNNMKILDAVYRSANHYQNPDSLYGYGIPNFRIAYEQLEKEANTISFENDWLLTVPNPFHNSLTVYLKAPETGKIQLRLLDALGRTLEAVSLDIITNETNKIVFKNVAKYPAGAYYLQYNSNIQKKVKKLLKQ